MSHVIAVIHEENGVYGVSFPDFPGCVSTGRSIDEVIFKGGQALALHVDGMIEDGEKPPILRDIAELRADPEFRADFEDATIAAVEVELPRKAVQVNISIDAGLLERLDRAAASSGQSRSAFLVEAARERLAKTAKSM